MDALNGEKKKTKHGQVRFQNPKGENGKEGDEVKNSRVIILLGGDPTVEKPM